MDNLLSVCVVIPSNRIDRRLVKCIRSVLSQEHQSFHVNLVLNGDIKNRKLDRLQVLFGSCEKISIFFLPEAKNANMARNFGKSRTSADFVAYLDSDDWWEKDFLSTVLKTARNECGDIFYSGMRVHYRHHVACRYAENHCANKSILDYLMSGGVAPTSGLVERRVAAINLNWDENLYRHQDYDYLNRAQMNGLRMVPVNTLINYDARDKSGKIPHVDDAIKFTILNYKKMTKKTFLFHLFKLVRNKIKYL